MLKHISEYMPPVDRAEMKRVADAARGERGTVAEAFAAQDLLRAAVEWHARNESERLPTALLAILCAARRVC